MRPLVPAGDTVSGGLPSFGLPDVPTAEYLKVRLVVAREVNPVAMSIIVDTFTDRAERARAIGIWGAAIGVSLALGPVVGGLLVASVGWRGIFWVNIPVGVAAIVLTAVFVPESSAPRPRRPDPAGQVLMIVMLASVVYGIIEGPRLGWSSAEIIGCFALSAVALGALILYEPRCDEPLLDLRFFRSAPFSGGTVIAIGSFAALGGFLFLNTLYLQDVRGYTGTARRAVHAAPRRRHRILLAVVRPNHRPPRAAAAPADRWSMPDRGRGDADRPDGWHASGLAGGLLCHFRHTAARTADRLMSEEAPLPVG